MAYSERLLDLSWSPAGDGFVLVSQQSVSGGKRYVVRFVDQSGEVRQQADLAAEPVAGSWVWAPDGHAAAFLARARALALATLGITDGIVRYVDDVGGGNLPSVGAIAPATFDRPGRLLYAAAPRNGNSRSGLPALLVVEPGRRDARRVGTVEPVFAPIVREDGIVLSLARASGDELVLRPISPDGEVLAEQRLGVAAVGPYSARWDLRRGRLLILRSAQAGGLDVLLLRFRDESAS